LIDISKLRCSGSGCEGDKEITISVSQYRKDQKEQLNDISKLRFSREAAKAEKKEISIKNQKEHLN
jgi:hypothetical protein